jgi:hypothetical protein
LLSNFANWQVVRFRSYSNENAEWGAKLRVKIMSKSLIAVRPLLCLAGQKAIVSPTKVSELKRLPCIPNHRSSAWSQVYDTVSFWMVKVFKGWVSPLTASSPPHWTSGGVAFPTSISGFPDVYSDQTVPAHPQKHVSDYELIGSYR